MNLKNVDLLKLQTSFMQEDKTTQGLCAGLNPELQNIGEQIQKIILFKTVNEVEDNDFGNALLDELAWQYHVDFYDTSASIEVKKNLVLSSVKIHKKKGTPQAVLDLIKASGFPEDTILMEWFDYNGDPYHFKIATSEMTTEQKAAFQRALDSVKNVRSYCDSIDYFASVLHEALSKITHGTEMEYTKSVGVGIIDTLAIGSDINVFAFQDGDTYGFIE